MHLCTTGVFVWRGVRSPSTTHATTSLRNFVNLLPLTLVTVDSINVKYFILKVLQNRKKQLLQRSPTSLCC